MKQICILIILIGFIQDLSAEQISGPANIRIEPNKDIIFSLNDSVEVSCTELSMNWYQIAVSIKVSEEVYEKQLCIKKGERLIDWNGKVIGVAINDIPLSTSYSWTSGGAPGNPKRFGMEIIGFTYKDNIYNWSIPENPLNKLISENNNDLKFSVFSKYINDFKFANYGLLKDLAPTLSEYMIYENYIDDPSPIDRIRLIFEDQKLVAIVHSRKLEIEKFETVDIQRSRKLTIVYSGEIDPSFHKLTPLRRGA